MSHHRHCANEEVLHKGAFILWLTEMSKYSKAASPPPLKKNISRVPGILGALCGWAGGRGPRDGTEGTWRPEDVLESGRTGWSPWGVGIARAMGAGAWSGNSLPACGPGTNLRGPRLPASQQPGRNRRQNEGATWRGGSRAPPVFTPSHCTERANGHVDSRR